jgi:CDP-paratose 2-epimerase
LASELLIEEYREMYGLRAIINRCGVVAGPWQMGKVDQGVFTLWVSAHRFGSTLKYIGFGGGGKQVRDLLHVSDLIDLLKIQLEKFSALDGRVFNVGGGRAVSLSLCETTALCERIVGRTIRIGSVPETRAGDVRVYITDNSAVTAATGWEPRSSPEQILADINDWISANETILQSIIG